MKELAENMKMTSRKKSHRNYKEYKGLPWKNERSEIQRASLRAKEKAIKAFNNIITKHKTKRNL